MMENDYTTVSNPPVDGWLGFFIGQELWYPLFDAKNVSGTANEIDKMISKNNNSSVQPSVRLPVSPSKNDLAPSNPSSSVKISEGKIDYDLLWTLLQDTDKIKDIEGMRVLILL